MVDMKDASGNPYQVVMNWIKVFDYEKVEGIDTTDILLVAGAFRIKGTTDCGIYLFKLNTKTGTFTPLINLMEDGGAAHAFRGHLLI